MSKASAETTDPPKAETATGTGPAPSTRQQKLDKEQQKEEIQQLPHAERLAALKHSALEVRSQWKLEEQRRQERHRQLIEDYKKHKEEKFRREKEERQRRLQELRKKNQQCSTTFSSAASFGFLDDDDEYRELMEKYGDKLRMVVPPSHNTSFATTMQFSTVSSGASTDMPLPRKPGVPRTARGKRPGQIWKKPKTKIEGTDGEDSATAKPPMSPQSLHSTRQLPQVGLGNTTGSTADKAALLSTAVPLPPVSDACRSLMPRKDKVRKRQQSLLKSTEVVFYKQQMKAHLARILNAVELTFDGSVPKHWKAATANLSNPLAPAMTDGTMTSVVTTAPSSH
eukprot:TRINITY_DN34163_c0_g1_i1.p1 TRINITY_DN34163_c0_g1~~TRINITY_DN34163_c0_g1_i1.p1  ORF type:complete len:340 (-),score=73.01 TRINITY_DN34163_c0_g1_i1:197-1216(-)